MVFPFKKYLLKEEKKATQDLMKVVEKTDIKKFRKIENKIRKLSKKISINEFSDKTFGYLLSEAGIISNLMGLPDEAEQMHQIRQSLKSMGNVIALVAPVFPSKEMDSMARKIKVIDRLIGSCHDHFVLLSALEKFTRHHEGKENETVSSLKSFSLLMRSEYEALAKSLNPKIKSQLTNLLGILVKTIPVQISIRHASPLLQ
jgi:CHAD domain-containing protein